LINSFKKHLAAIHNSQTSELTNNPVTVSFHLNELESFNSSRSFVNTPTTNTDRPPIEPLLVDDFNNHNLQGNQIEQFLASLYANSQIPRNVVQTITKGV
jgi:hypothetical protein